MLRKVKKSPGSAAGGPAYGGHQVTKSPGSVKSSIFFCLLSGLLLAVPFNNGKLWIFSWFGFVPLFFALENKTKARAFFLGCLTGIVFWSFTVYWLINVTLAGTIVLILYLALYFGIFAIIFSWAYLLPTTYYLLFVSSAWVLFEYVRSHLFTGFPWALLGYSQYLNLPVIQIADITGTWGISFLLILANVAVVEIIWSVRHRLWPRLKITVTLLILFLFISLSYGYYRLHSILNTQYSIPKSIPIKISLIQANIPQELKWDPDARLRIIDKYFALTKLAAKDKADLIIWPEAALPVIPQEEPQLFEEVRYLAAETGAPLLLGVVTAAADYHNSAILLSDTGDIIGQYDKIHRVPFGEYIPLRKLFPFLETVVPIGDIAAGKEYTVFKGHQVTKSQGHKVKGHKPEFPNFSVLICFEDVFPELARRFSSLGADFLVNITNDGWYKETPAAYQHLQASVLRATENRMPVVRSANTGVSAFIGPAGKIISTVHNSAGKEIFIDGYKTSAISIPQKSGSFYTRFGDIFVLICCILAVWSIILNQNLKLKIVN